MIERIGPYEVRGLLGQGGMGDVYRAHDPRLGRDVAIKVLPRLLMDDAERLARLEREARALAALSHPHIATIFGLEEAAAPAGTRTLALVLELIDGEGLDAHIARHPHGLPLARALEIARQIADGFDAAHERGIVHRDLKPANVKISSSGAVKILDFGLARVAEPAGSMAAVTAPTLSNTIIGTPAYMSPEQARGEFIDKRADIWAFGCVLYEMLAGRRAFPGSSISETLVALMTAEPDWSAIPPQTPTSLVTLLHRCLAKNPRDRLRDIGDAIYDLDHPTSTRAVVAVAAAPAEVQFKRLADFEGIKESPAISPDGKMVVFVALVGQRRHIWLQRLAGGAPLRITHDDVDHEQPRWAPDSDTLVYFTPSAGAGDPGTIFEISTLGGTPRPIVAAATSADISHAGDRLAFFADTPEGRALVTTTREGLDPRRVTIGDPWQTSPPRWSPDDRWLAFQGNVVRRFDERLCVTPADRDDVTVVARAGSLRGFCWRADGRGFVYSSSAGSTIVYPPTCNLRRVGIDGTGDAQVTFGDDSYGDPDEHPTGKLVACRIRAQSDVWKIPVGGTPAENTAAATRVTRQTGQVQTPSASPNGREVVFLSDTGGHGNLWIAGVETGAVRQLTFERDPLVSVGVPGWSPAGDRIVFVVSRRGRPVLWLINPDGRGLRQLVEKAVAAYWSRDGAWIYYVPSDDALTYCIERIRVDGGERLVVVGDGNAHAPVAGDGVLYYARRVRHGTSWLWEICRIRNGDSRVEAVARLDPSRIPVSTEFVQGMLSPDGASIALPLMDGATTNLWLIPTEGGPLRSVTDFGERAIVIGRQVSWSPDGQAIYAAVAETTTDVVLLDGLMARG